MRGKAADLRELVQDILKQFQSVNATVANGPHVELNMQELRVIERTPDGPLVLDSVPVRFVPLVGEQGYA